MPELRRSARVAARPAKEPEAVTEQPPTKKVKTAPTNTAKPDAGLEIGGKIPDVTLLNQDGEEISLTEVAKGSKYVVIFAFPRASTSGCARQVSGFRKLDKDYKDVSIFGVSSDSVKAQKNFQTKQNAEYDLLSDPEKKLIGALGAKKHPLGIIRSHWIFVDGVLKVKQIQVSPEVSFTSAEEEIKKFINENENGKEATENDVTKEEVKEESQQDDKEDNTEQTDEKATEQTQDEVKKVSDETKVEDETEEKPTEEQKTEAPVI